MRDSGSPRAMPMCLLLLGLAGCCLFGADAPALFRVETESPIIAGRTFTGEIRVEAASRAEVISPEAWVIDGHGRSLELALEPRGGGRFGFRATILRSGEATVLVADRAAGRHEGYLVDVASAAPARVMLAVAPLILKDGRSVLSLKAAVEDEYHNVVARAPEDFEWTASHGRVDEVTTDPSGRLLATLSAAGPGTTKIKVQDRKSGLSVNQDALLPEIALRGPGWLILKEGAKPEFPVDIYVNLYPLEKLKGFELSLELGELAGGGRFEAATSPLKGTRLVADGKTLKLTGGPYRDLYNPGERAIYIGRIWLDCLGVGESALRVTSASYSVARSPVQDRQGQPELWERKGCENKRRVKKLCINPIVLGTSWTHNQILAELQQLQDNLDEACCTITVEVGGKSLDQLPPNSLTQKRVDGIRNEDGYANDPGYVENGFKLTKAAEDLLRRSAALRDPNCLNVYFAASLFRFPIYRTINGVRTFIRISDGFSGTTITGRLSSPDGTGSQAVPLKDSQGRPIGQGSPLRLEDVSGVFLSGQAGRGNRTAKHEIGHALGLRHPNEYAPGSPLAREGNRVMEQGEGKGSKFSRGECEIIMRNMNGFLKDF